MKKLKNIIKIQSAIMIVGVLAIAKPGSANIAAMNSDFAQTKNTAVIAPVRDSGSHPNPNQPTKNPASIDLSKVDWKALGRHMYGRCGEWRNLALSVGWPAAQWPTLSKVLYRESRCNIGSFNPSDPNGGSRGLMQINGFWCKPNRYTTKGWLQDNGIVSTCEDLFNPEVNLRAGLAMWNYSEIRNGCGWRPWATRCS